MADEQRAVSNCGPSEVATRCGHRSVLEGNDKKCVRFHCFVGTTGNSASVINL